MSSRTTTATWTPCWTTWPRPRPGGARFILRYEVAGHRYIAIPNLGEHQRFHKEEKSRGLPAPPQQGANTTSTPPQHGAEPVPAPPQQGAKSPENGDGERRRTPENRAPEAPPAAPSPPEKLGACRPPLADQLEAVFLEEKGHAYEWDFANEQAVRSLLKHKQVEVLRRWRIGLLAGFPACNTVRDLVRNWNAYATDQPPRGGDGKPFATARNGALDVGRGRAPDGTGYDPGDPFADVPGGAA
jgi:hypothetical protein